MATPLMLRTSRLQLKKEFHLTNHNQQMHLAGEYVDPQPDPGMIYRTNDPREVAAYNQPRTRGTMS